MRTNGHALDYAAELRIGEALAPLRERFRCRGCRKSYGTPRAHQQWPVSKPYCDRCWDEVTALWSMQTEAPDVTWDPAFWIIVASGVVSGALWLAAARFFGWVTWPF